MRPEASLVLRPLAGFASGIGPTRAPSGLVQGTQSMRPAPPLCTAPLALPQAAADYCVVKPGLGGR